VLSSVSWIHTQVIYKEFLGEGWTYQQEQDSQLAPPWLQVEQEQSPFMMIDWFVGWV